MPDSPFFDTNILIYAFSAGDYRHETAMRLLLGGGGVAIQSLNEFANVSTRKMRLSWPDTRKRLGVLQRFCSPLVPLTLSVHFRGIAISQLYGFSIYDSMLLAAAVESSATVFYSEDLQHGQVVEGVTIVNPFIEIAQQSSTSPSRPSKN